MDLILLDIKRYELMQCCFYSCEAIIFYILPGTPLGLRHTRQYTHIDTLGPMLIPAKNVPFPFSNILNAYSVFFLLL